MLDVTTMDGIAEQALIKAIGKIGYGNALVGADIITDIAYRLEHARRKHPEFVENFQDGLAALLSEVKEVREALEQEDIRSLRDELFDVIAVGIRMMNYEFGCRVSQAG